jgi:hypothetical protein
MLKSTFPSPLKLLSLIDVKLPRLYAEVNLNVVKVEVMTQAGTQMFLYFFDLSIIMNFKITKAKTIVSVIVGIFFALFSMPILSSSLGYTLLRFIIGLLIGFGLVYIIWSLIQRVPAE